jgi:PAS domain S-box-containing protein
MTAVEEARLWLVLGVEKFALVARNLALVLMAAMFVGGYVRGHHLGLATVAAIVVVHSLFSLWIYLSGRFEFFQSPWNFALNLAEISLTVAFTGGADSVLYILFLFFLVAFGTYTRQPRLVLFATGLCLLCFGGIVLVDGARIGFDISYAVVVLQLSAIAACGWLMASITRVLGRAEESSMAREHALASSEATLRTILDSAADPIFVYDNDEFITDANDRACTFLAVPRCKLLGQRIRAFLFDDGTLPNKMSVLRARGEYHGEQIFVNSYGEERTVDLRVRSYSRGGQRFFVAVGPDITEQKNLREASRLANIHLEKLNQELKQVNELRRSFLTAISQKLRSPLTALLGYTDMLLDGELGDVTSEQRTALQACRRTALRAFDLIDEALDLDLSREEKPEQPGVRSGPRRR